MIKRAKEKIAIEDNNIIKNACGGGTRVLIYDWVRLIATILVIIGHSTYYYIMTQYGGCDYTAFTLPKLSNFYRMAEYMVSIIYLFHMPLYMALSGALYRRKNLTGGVLDIWTPDKGQS